MSEQVTSVEVDDLLASVRRLVSDKDVPARQAPQAADKLVLTPSLRIDEALSDEAIAEDVSDAEVRFVAPSRPLRVAPPEAEAEETPVEETDEWQVEPADEATVWLRAPDETPEVDESHDEAAEAVTDLEVSEDVEVEAEAEPIIESEIELKASADLDAFFAQILPEGAPEDEAEVAVAEPVLALAPEDSVNVDAAISELVGADLQDQPEDVAQDITPEAVIDEVTDAAPLEVEADDVTEAVHNAVDAADAAQKPEEVVAKDIAPEAEDAAAFFRSESHHDRHARLEATIAELEAAVQSHGQDDFEPDGSEVEVELQEWEDATPIEDGTADDVADEFVAAEPVADDIEELEDLGLPAGDLDEGALRLLIADVLREELRGEIGERITRNVRKLIRREIYRILTTEEMER